MLEKSKNLPTLDQVSVALKLRGAQKKLAKKILLSYARKTSHGKKKIKETAKKPPLANSLKPDQQNYAGLISIYKNRPMFDSIFQKKPMGGPVLRSLIPLKSLSNQTVFLAKKTGKNKPQVTPPFIIHEALGPIQDPRIDSKVIIWKNELHLSFSDKCMAEAEQMRFQHDSKRVDLRHIPFVTIDGADAKDFDDAVAIDAQGNVWVAVADVSNYVLPDTEIDLEACKRGNSYYFPDCVVPMLPEKLSNDLCSLRPNEDKMCVAIKLSILKNGDITYHTPVEAVMCSRARLTYDQVDHGFKNNTAIHSTEELNVMLGKLHKITQLMLKRRIELGGIDFDLTESKFNLNPDGTIKDITVRRRSDAQSLIEELMLAANKSVAEILHERRIPSVYRVHDLPAPGLMSDFVLLLKSIGIKTNTVGPDETHDLGDIIKVLGNDHRSKIIRQCALRTMKQAYYGSKNLGHFGLGFSHYLHFTSPIRRYSDLIVHRSLKNLMGQKLKLFPNSFDSLETVATHLSLQERVAQRAEFDIRDIKSVRFMADKIGKSFKGHISSVLPSGFFVELTEYPIEGFVPLFKLENDQWVYKEDLKSLFGKIKRQSWKIADPIKVRLDKVSMTNNRIDFSLDKS